MSARRNKYGAKPQVVDGVRFASKAEAKRDAELVLLEKLGKIHGLTRQPRFPLKVDGKLICTYVGDWTYFENVGDERAFGPIVEDKKGTQTQAFKIKWKLAKALYPHIEWRIT